MKYFLLISRNPILLALLSVVVIFRAQAQAPDWQMAIAPINNNGYSRATAVAADNSGNVYITGFYSGTISFGSTTLASPISGAVFVAKWSNTTNSFIWAKHAVGVSNSSDGVRSIAIVGNSIYIAGNFSNPQLVFDNTALVNQYSYIYGSQGSSDGFIAKLIDAGSTANWNWAQRLNTNVTSIAASASGLYIAGSFSQPTVSLGATALVNTGREDVFVAKLTDLGNTSSFVWAQRAGGTMADVANTVAVSGTSVYVAGRFEGRGVPASFGNTTLVNTGFKDAFIAKLTDAGNTATFTWALSPGGRDDEEATAMAVSGTSVYVAGNFDGEINIGNRPIYSDGSSDSFVLKVADTGNAGSFVWSQRAGGSSFDDARAVTVIGSSIYLAGYFNSLAATFGPTILSTNNGPRVFISKLNDTGTAGSFAWARQSQDVNQNYGLGVAIGGTKVFVVGEASPSASFGTHSLSGSSTAQTAFLSSLNDPIIMATAASRRLLGVELMPNPARTSTSVQLPAIPGAASATLILTDALGRAVRTAIVRLPAAGLRHELSLMGLAPGIYALRVQAGATTAMRQLVVE